MIKQGFSAGASLEVTLKFADYENVKPSYWAGIVEEWEVEEENKKSTEDILNMISAAQDLCRQVCEMKIDKDIYDVKEIKLYKEILNKKGGK